MEFYRFVVSYVDGDGDRCVEYGVVEAKTSASAVVKMARYIERDLEGDEFTLDLEDEATRYRVVEF